MRVLGQLLGVVLVLAGGGLLFLAFIAAYTSDVDPSLPGTFLGWAFIAAYSGGVIFVVSRWARRR